MSNYLYQKLEKKNSIKDKKQKVKKRFFTRIGKDRKIEK